MKLTEYQKELIKRDILFALDKDNFLWTSEVARKISRDEEFTKKLLNEMYEDKILLMSDKNEKGKIFLLRKRWKLNKEE
jgi:hypothetical protein